MNIFFHDRHQIISQVPAVDAAALERVQTHGRHRANDNDRKIATKLLSDLRDRQEWLACSCQGTQIEPPPLMSPRLREGQIHLWRHGVTPHVAACPFAGDEPRARGDESQDDDEDTIGGELRPWDGRWLLLKQVTDQRPQSAPATEGPQRESRTVIPALGRLLFTILDKAGYTILGADSVTTMKGQVARSKGKSPYADLERVFDEPVGEGLVFRNVGCTFLPALHQHLKNLEGIAKKFPAKQRPQGLFVGVVDEINEVKPHVQELLWRGGKDNRVAVATVEGPVHRSGFGSEKGPFWVIAQLAASPGDHRFRAVAAYAQPCLSRSVLLPVDSDLERLTAELLLSQMTYWQRKEDIKIEVQLEKPLFDLTVTKDQWCRPDFQLWLPNGRRVIIETMGLEDREDYVRSKQVTHPRMKQLPGTIALVEHRPNSEPWEKLARQLTAIVARDIREHPAS